MASNIFNEELDVESLRHSHESNTEWRLRKSFLDANKTKFPLSSLVCLSCCFINCQVYGNRYPAAVMAQLQDLSSDLPKDVREFNKQRQEEAKIKFVRSKEADSNSGGIKFVRSQEQLSQESDSRSDGDRCNSVMTFVKANSDFQSTDVAFQKPEHRVNKPLYMPEESTSSNVSLPRKGNFKQSLQNFQTNLQKFEVNRRYDVRFGKLTKQLRTMESNDKNSISKLHLATDRLRILLECTIGDTPTVQNGQKYFVTDICLDSVLIASGQGLSKKSSKHDAYTKAIEKLSSPFFRVIELERGQLELETSNKPFDNPAQRKRNHNIAFVRSESEEVESNEASLANYKKQSRGKIEHGLTEFIIMEPAEPTPGLNATTTLRQSADFSRMLLEFEFRDVGSGVRCRVFLESQFVEEDFAPAKNSAKIGASEKALEKLRGCCWTIVKKGEVDCDDANVTREELMGDINKLNEAISSDNVGSRLLQKMGWRGGGVGKEGNKGIAEPVSLTSVINREGLGLMAERGIEVDFMPKVKTILMEYARSTKQNELAFSAQFNKEERAIIHQECRKLGLKSGSKGKGDNRFLIVSRKRTATQLLSHVMHSGGSTSKYDLLPPGTRHEAGN